MTHEKKAMTSADVRRKHAEYLFPAVGNYYEESVVLQEGKGSRVTDLDGKTYLDFFGGILTVSVGHANPRVNEAIVAQVQRLSHVSTLYPTLPIVELAERLAQVTPGALQKSFFLASGTEANEMAVAMAQVATGNTELVALRHGYSGRSLLGQALTAHSPYRSLPSATTVRHAPAPYCYRCPFHLTYPSCGVACAKDLEELIQTTTTGRVAGMLAEPIQGVGGFITPPKEYFTIAAEIIRKYGGVFIADEVQTGFGRTGTTWGIEGYDVEPDMMTMAKGIANGLPLGACVATPAVADSFTHKLSISTFGGNPVATAAANAVLEQVIGDDLPKNCAERGAELREGLLRLQRAYPKIIGDVRGKGLMQALELVVDETSGDRTPNVKALKALFEATRERGMLIGKGGLHGNVVRLTPMLNATRDEVAEGLSILEAAFGALGTS